jgi:single-stranded-DNA-specific exonuclease
MSIKKYKGLCMSNIIGKSEESYITDKDIALSYELGISPIILAVLRVRGQSLEDFTFSNNPNDITSPFKLKGMEKSIERINKAIKNNEKICFYTDYDVDGITSAVVLNEYFSKFTSNYIIKLPDRQTEGYGLNSDVIRALKEDGVSLIVSADCGITAVEQVAVANELGIDVIITDHHEPKEELPKAYSIINPKLDKSGVDYFSGCAIAWQLIRAYNQQYGNLDEEFINDMLDIVCVSTIADMVTIKGDNRIIIKYGLEVMNKPFEHKYFNYGLQRLIDAFEFDKFLNEGDISFYIGPAINACGRIDNPYKAFNTLTCKEYQIGMGLAYEMIALNNQRKEYEADVIKQCIEKIQIQDLDNLGIFIDYNGGWEKGVVGIAASKVLEEIHRPVILFGGQPDEEGYVHGSARTITGISIFNLFVKISELYPDILEYDRFGGHDMAAGLSIHVDKIEDFKKVCNQYILENFDESVLTKTIKYDIELPLDYINEKTIREIEKLAPFGIGNPRPVFLFTNFKLVGMEYRKMKQKDKYWGKYLLRTKKYKKEIQAVYFNVSDEMANTDMLPDNLLIIGNANINVYKGYKNIQLMCKYVEAGELTPA